MVTVAGGTDVKIVEGEACLLLLLFLPRLEPGNVSAHLSRNSESPSLYLLAPLCGDLIGNRQAVQG